MKVNESRLGNMSKKVNSTDTKGITFTVANVQPTTQPLPEIPYQQAINELFLAERLVLAQSLKIKACSRHHNQLLVAHIDYHPLVAALHLAYAHHHPLSLSPDLIWLLICQGVAHHINANAEQLRPQLVQYQEQLIINHQEFHQGFPDNSWYLVLNQFSALLKKCLGNQYELFVANFSTTEATERVAAEIVLMEAMPKYFHSELDKTMGGGIPTITLEGTPTDWQNIMERVEAFVTLELDWWLKPLRSILREWVAAAQGKSNPTFWRFMYRIYPSTGQCSLESATGWIALFFPYLNDKQGIPTRRNSWLTGKRNLKELLSASQQHGVYNFQFPTGLAKAPVVYLERNDCGNILRRYDMEFLAGFMGVTQNPNTLCLRPEMGWALRDSLKSFSNPRVPKVKMNTLTTYIFLDIDGVLVKEEVFTEINLEEDLPHLDESCANWFAETVRRYPHTKIVISSSWREIYSLEVIKSVFPKDIADRIEGITPLYNRPVKFFRYQQVLDYLETHDALEQPWVAIDDIREHYPPQVLVIVTNPYVGFNETSAEELARFLNQVTPPMGFPQRV
jgi:Domain of unknown function (DUF4419)/HAD domain in Swiss Army Knife RNA repair proteins